MTSERNIWSAMKSRCSNQRNKAFVHYGGRGITVCTRWVNSFLDFYADMGPRPSTQHSIDRIDVNGNYEPANCRWATAKEQGRNTRRTPRIEIDGKSAPVADLTQETGVTTEDFFRRKKMGVPEHMLLARKEELIDAGLMSKSGRPCSKERRNNQMLLRLTEAQSVELRESAIFLGVSAQELARQRALNRPGVTPREMARRRVVGEEWRRS